MILKYIPDVIVSPFPEIKSQTIIKYGEFEGANGRKVKQVKSP